MIKKTNNEFLDKNLKITIRVILAGILLNGFIQGQSGENLKNEVLDEALKEIEKRIKLLKKGR